MRARIKSAASGVGNETETVLLCLSESERKKKYIYIYICNSWKKLRRQASDISLSAGFIFLVGMIQIRTPARGPVFRFPRGG